MHCQGISSLNDLNCDFKKELGANVGDNDKEKAIFGPGFLSFASCLFYQILSYQSPCKSKTSSSPRVYS